jgi:hypothetical protein
MNATDRGTDSYRSVPFPIMRRLVVDSGRYSRRVSSVYGLVEFDVTEARRRLGTHRERMGEPLSLTSYIAACLGRAVAADRSVHAYRDWRNRLIIFDDVDLALMVEVRTPAGSFPQVHVLRAADKRTPRELDAEIRALQAGRGRDNGLGNGMAARLFLRLPRFARDVVYRYFAANPRSWKRLGGTVGLTVLGLLSRGGGWGIQQSNSTLSVCIGGIVERPAFVGDVIAKREFLNVTVQVNHDIVDGGPAARFTARFKKLVETASLLAPDPGAPPARLPTVARHEAKDLQRVSVG